MFNLLFVVFLAPFLGFVVLSIGRNRFSESTAAAIGIGSLGCGVRRAYLRDFGNNRGSTAGFLSARRSTSA